MREVQSKLARPGLRAGETSSQTHLPTTSATSYCLGNRVRKYGTCISGNNIVGYYWNGSTWQGFLYNGSPYTTLSVPGATNTYAYGIAPPVYPAITNQPQNQVAVLSSNVAF